ncbi:hypothetical protein [Pseudoclavibacter sp. RFBA6]|uniref:hypothetical protein n=1 Tax=Pseudoclavibacter sp. RFBA6 TaxID=2080573 RepID=UPI000CE72560|nr:hypothetical protein [Pseudoclavibacter sp. RFBA6]PPG43737.1 hypothetical protein C5C17_00440 [Pseudoclavibacter sp. RFBA6]
MARDSMGRAESPYRKPGFIASAAVVGVIAVLGVVVVTVGLLRPDAAPTETTPSASASVTATVEPTPVAEPVSDASMCGLPRVEMEGRLDAAPAALWEATGSFTYPISTESGPGVTLPSGVRACFERTPAGAVFAASAGVAQLGDPGRRQAFVDASVVGPLRAELQEAALTATPDDGAMRMSVSGYKLLSYDGVTARVDVGMTGVGMGQTVYLSSIVPLEWADGDWKLAYERQDAQTPALLPNLAGYVMWGV